MGGILLEAQRIVSRALRAVNDHDLVFWGTIAREISRQLNGKGRAERPGRSSASAADDD
jgi:hypothetical protein